MSYVTAVESTAEPDPLPAMGDATPDEERATPDHQQPEHDDQPDGDVKPLAGFGGHCSSGRGHGFSIVSYDLFPARREPRRG